MLARIFDGVKGHQTISVSCSIISDRHARTFSLIQFYSGVSSFEGRKNKVLYFLLRIVPFTHWTCCVTESRPSENKTIIIIVIIIIIIQLAA